jgi:hypothetical protein
MSATHIVRSIVLACACASAASAQPATAIKPTPEGKGPAGPQGFSVVLVLGDMQSASTSDNVPPAARKALADMKDFLPYRGYRLLDAQWILGSERATTRLRGPDEQDYELTLRSSTFGTNQPLRVMFRLQEPGSAASVYAEAREVDQRRAQLADLQARLQQLEREAAALRERGGENQREVNANLRAINAQIAELKRQIPEGETALTIGRGRSVIDTTFSMDIGETVVVGTSRTRGGDKALIALLTAVPRGSTPKRED